MNYIEINAPAKINLGLNIIEKRIDGFHNLLTLFYPLFEICDVLKFRKAESFAFYCDRKDISNPEDNLIYKAKHILERESDRSLNVEIGLKKNIPMGAGLGGGSSDAAAALISLNELFELGFKYEKLLQFALELGSDVPFFLKAKPAIGKSRGEVLEIVNLEINEPILIINPGIHISTKEAFSNITPKYCSIDYKTFLKDSELNYEICKENMVNDFESFVFNKFPEIQQIKKLMIENGAKYSSMSGSGSTVYGIFENLSNAEKVLNLFPDEYLKLINTP